MFDVLGIIGLFAAGKQIIKEKTEKEIPASYWNNKDLIHKDKMNPDVSPQQLMKNLESGKYYSPTVIPEKYEQPVKIMDRKRYEEDIIKYGEEIVCENAKLGMYSFVLEPEEEKPPCHIVDTERYELDVKELGRAIANGKARAGLYNFISKNRL